MNLRRIPIPLIITTLVAARVVCHNEQQKQIAQAKQEVIDSVKQVNEIHNGYMPASNIYAQIISAKKSQENMTQIKKDAYKTGYDAAVDSMKKVAANSKDYHETFMAGWNSRKNFTNKIRADETRLEEKADEIGRKVMRAVLNAPTVETSDSISNAGQAAIKRISAEANTLVYMHGSPAGYRFGKGHMKTVYDLAQKAVADSAKAALKK